MHYMPYVALLGGCKLYFVETANGINQDKGLFKARNGPSNRATNHCNSFKAGF